MSLVGSVSYISKSLCLSITALCSSSEKEKRLTEGATWAVQKRGKYSGIA